jgi:site-specific DNA-methyltransferase (adenine-specific)
MDTQFTPNKVAEPHNQSPNWVVLGESLAVLSRIPSKSVDLIYIDPPFNTGKHQSRTRIATIQDVSGARVGFGGKRYQTVERGRMGFDDTFDDYLGFLEPRLLEAYRVLAPHGALYFHIDCHEAHYCKMLLDSIFERDNFINEIIWAYDYGAKPKTRWPAKHDTVFFYVKDNRNYVFNVDAIEREPYMAPGLVTPEKAERGKLPTDVWWHTIVPTNGSERTGYPTQKPLGILKRIITASSNPGDLVLDFFAGSGTTGEAALLLGRRFILVDNNPNAIPVMQERFNGFEGVRYLDTSSVGWGEQFLAGMKADK